MKKEEIHSIVEAQRAFFDTGVTLNVDFRIYMLQKLRKYIKKYENDLYKAIRKDLGKSKSESYMCEVGLTLSEISYMEKHVKSLAKDHSVWTNLANFAAHCYTKPSPYGVTLIMSPWNYPLLLTLEPLVDAIAAGNTVVLKPSAYSPYTSRVMKKMIDECFDERYVAMITGGRAENTDLLDEKWDYIFFTGSGRVGREVMRKASANLTPVSLELGGKSPCIVDKTANLPLAARRIVFGKLLNCGQTCVAPDYIYCDPEIKDLLIVELKREIIKQYGAHPLENPDYGKIINDKHFRRIQGLIDPEKVVHGGGADADSLQIEPTILDNVTFDDAIMQEEIFGPVLPVLTYTTLEQAINTINRMPHPLALYHFTTDRHASNKVMGRCQYGGGCINDTIVHIATSEMGFGGFGDSGMGSYHGKAGFEAFSHKKSILNKMNFIDVPMRYQPYKNINAMLIHMFLR